MSRKDWVEIGKRRVVNILRSRLYATIRQLEVKISEAGPNNQRADPLIISDALGELQRESVVSVDKCDGFPNFYYLTGYFDPDKRLHAERKATVQRLQAQYTSVCQKQHLCGDALELVVWNAINQIPSFSPLGGMATPILHFGKIELPGALDFTLLMKEGNCLLAGEMKNLREWVYPQTQELWGLIGKAVRLLDNTYPVLPIFVARKIPYVTRLYLSKIGMLGFETHHQYFMPKAELKLTQIKHKDGLGFHDIKTDLTASPALLNFFTKIVPCQAETYVERFRKNRILIYEYAIEQGLESKKFNGPDRSSVFNEFKQALASGDDYESEQDYEPEPEDYD